jgi:hypothetical protein
MSQNLKMKKIYALHPPGMYVSVPEGYKRTTNASLKFKALNKQMVMYVGGILKLPLKPQN